MSGEPNNSWPKGSTPSFTEQMNSGGEGPVPPTGKDQNKGAGPTWGLLGLYKGILTDMADAAL